MAFRGDTRGSLGRGRDIDESRVVRDPKQITLHLNVQSIRVHPAVAM